MDFSDRLFNKILLFSLAAHGAFFAATAMSLKAEHYAVTQASSSIDVAIVYETAPSPKPPQETPLVTQAPAPERVEVPPEEEKPLPPQEKPEPVVRTQGAVVEAKVDAVYNPAPVYPQQARRNGWQGEVVLKVSVDAQGLPQEVFVEKSSGYAILDQAAAKAIRRWRFKPAQLGGLALSSTVMIPVKFILQESL